MINRNDRIRGSLIGGAIGDALGYPIEFQKNIKNKQYTRFEGKGIISDDTQMTLFTANALIWRDTRGFLKGIAPSVSDALYLAYKDWLSTQIDFTNENKISWIKDLDELNVQRAPGNTCLSALSSGKKGTIENPINNSKGCGGIMRVAPIGIYIRDSKEAGKYAAEAAAITHGHPLGIIPSYVFAVLISLIVNHDMKIDDAFAEALKIYHENFEIYDNDTQKYFLDLVIKIVELVKSDLSDVEAIKKLGEGWVAEEAFAIAMYSCLKYSNNFEEAIICAVNHDGDSDSTGAIAGNIIGASLGYSKIPDYFINNLELKDVILELADDLSIPIPVSEYSSNNDEYWLSKYLYCKRNLSLSKNMNDF